MTLVPKDLADKISRLLLGGGVGAGVTIALVLADKEPKALIDTFSHWGAASLIGLVAMFLVSQGVSRGFTRAVEFGAQVLEVGRENAAAQQKLADAVNQIAQRDDERARELELVVGHLARNSRQILEDLGEIKRQLATSSEGKANAHTASH